MFELAAGHNVKPAAHLCEMIQYRKISIRLHRETQCVWNLAQASVELPISICDRRAAIEVRWRSEGSCRVNEVDLLAENMLDTFFASGFFPVKMRREFRWIDKRQFLACIARSRAHRTFNTTSVRSSESGALWANQSTSRKITSASSVALTSC